MTIEEDGEGGHQEGVGVYYRKIGMTILEKLYPDRFRGLNQPASSSICCERDEIQ